MECNLDRRQNEKSETSKGDRGVAARALTSRFRFCFKMAPGAGYGRCWNRGPSIVKGRRENEEDQVTGVPPSF